MPKYKISFVYNDEEDLNLIIEAADFHDAVREGYKLWREHPEYHNVWVSECPEKNQE